MTGIRGFSRRWVFPYLPYPHFMGLAPLDSVLALLLRTRPRVPVVLWPRLALLLFFSALSTLLSLPERLAIATWLHFRLRTPAPHEAPIFVLGYFRSGTTWLQTLLSRDPALRSPIWVEALSPQTFVVTWFVLRLLLAPFLMLVRIRAVSPLGTTLPAEDDFALCNWARTSVIAGRAVFPGQQDFYNRFHDLDRLTPAERARWEHYEKAFVGKLLLTAKGRRPLLKSPSHTARVRHLLRLFPGAKFIHISRSPRAVFQSNLALIKGLQDAFRLGRPIDTARQEEMIVEEYRTTMERYVADRGLIPPGDLAELRLQDLAADPLGEIERLYGELGLAFSATFRLRLVKHLGAGKQRKPLEHPALTPAQETRAARLDPLGPLFGHDRPTIAKA
jgi:omega-hydroxy-beta-dihydromenaquinone-9 sulfotransferase